MAGRLLTRCVSRAVLKLTLGAEGRVNKGTCRNYWTGLWRTTATTARSRAPFLVTFPVLSCLGYKAYQWVHIPAVVCALERDELLEQADYLYSCAETEKLYQLLLQHKDSDDAEFLWRLARASRDLSQLPDLAAERKKALVFEAFEYATKALEKDEQCFAAHKWYAVCLSDVGEYGGVKVKIGNSYIIRKHLEEAVKLNPKDATSLHILGYWCFAFAELPWYQRKVAAMIFSTPPDATYEEALEFFLKAEEVDPNFYSMNMLMLGKTYLALKETEKATMWLIKAKQYQPHTNEDKEVHKEAVELLKKL
ncbi:regulator of microtubule dynamics protein 1 [Gouania willdenowi]|uniref:Regulator of microtubule dynamics protein 1 n=1 Tax=Gouania willdenowi TaxID=441366 RepID=A0A8C5EFU1_GOUWI|nr:regulator of microtubule dynamics protein 1 [Gouania willdenowi]